MVLQFSLKHKTLDTLVVISLEGYLDKTGGVSLKGFLNSCLKDGFRQFALDFTTIELLNSQGIAALLDVATRVVDENNGNVWVFGIPTDKASVLDLAGFFFLATQVADETEALKMMQESQ